MKYKEVKNISAREAVFDLIAFFLASIVGAMYLLPLMKIELFSYIPWRVSISILGIVIITIDTLIIIVTGVGKRRKERGKFTLVELLATIAFFISLTLEGIRAIVI